jgi:UDP-glucose 4-epimerase
MGAASVRPEVEPEECDWCSAQGNSCRTPIGGEHGRRGRELNAATKPGYTPTMGKRALVTGGAGFIGSHVAEHCLRQGLDVTVVDDLSGGFRENVPEGAQFVQGDLRQSDFVDTLWAETKFDYVYHLAAYAAEGLSHFVRRFNYETNLISSINVLNNAVKHGAACYVFASSIAVYGPGQVPMHEGAVPHPEDPYGISKYAVELDLQAAHRLFGLNYVIFRPHNVYGERQNIADKYRNVIGIFMNQAMSGLAMTIFGDGTQTRAFSHVDDVAPIIAAAPQVKGALNRVFNVGADTPYTVNDLAKEVAEAFGLPPKVTHLPERQEVKHAFSDHAQVREVFGHKPPVELGEGIRRMAKWAKQVGSRRPVTFENIELGLNLPQSWR